MFEEPRPTKPADAWCPICAEAVDARKPHFYWYGERRIYLMHAPCWRHSTDRVGAQDTKDLIKAAIAAHEEATDAGSEIREA